MEIPFRKADILIPKSVNMEKWAVVACDQYTSEPEYWKEVEELVGEEPSTLKIIVPEVYLEDDNILERIEKVNKEMDQYIAINLFNELDNSVIYVERTQSNGKIRRGIIGAIDLEYYCYEKGSKSLIRTTEETVIERVPPRVRVRKNASLETPHIMLLIDDENKSIIDELGNKVDGSQKVYDFKLMQNGGYIKGYKLNETQIQEIFDGVERLSDNENFNKRYNIKNEKTLLFSVGDGNHSLATAKICYEELKKKLPKEEYENHPARYALVEIENVHSEALEFEPIHRVMFEINPEHVMNEIRKYYEVSSSGDGHKIEYMYKRKEGTIVIKDPKSNLEVGSLQTFIDDYLEKNHGKVDYIHGEEVVRRLANQEGNIGFLVPTMKKSDLFKTVILDGALPRKTFSMGHNNDKRFYLEVRKIKE